mgnify:CR=1 FL=1
MLVHKLLQRAPRPFNGIALRTLPTPRCFQALLDPCVLYVSPFKYSSGTSFVGPTCLRYSHANAKVARCSKSSWTLGSGLGTKLIHPFFATELLTNLRRIDFPDFKRDWVVADDSFAAEPVAECERRSIRLVFTVDFM